MGYFRVKATGRNRRGGYVEKISNVIVLPFVQIWINDWVDNWVGTNNLGPR
jgi:hypothetical protein